MNAKLLFGAVIAIILLGLYGFSLIVAIRLALSAGGGDLNSGISYTLATVGGLVSALVITELSISKPGESPGARLFESADPNAPRSEVSSSGTAGMISIIYVLVWILLGLAAFVVGVLLRPDVVKALTDFGQAWLGLAVAAAYAYFGVKP